MNAVSRISWQAITLKFHQPFRLSTGVSTTRQAYWICLEEDQGWGEGTIPPYYGVKDEWMVTYWNDISRKEQPFPNDPEGIPFWVGDEGPAPARAAVDLALYDRIGKLNNTPVYKILGMPKPLPKVTAFTIAIDTPEAMAKAAAERIDNPIIKLKLGSEDDISRVAAVRNARPDVRLYVDANAGWTPKEAVKMAKALSKYHLEMIEQPVPGEDFEGLGYVQAHTDIPIVADESLKSLADVDRLAREGVQGANLKIMKLGGISNTMEVLKRAKQKGLKVMLGCMSETSLGVTAMAHLTAWADWIDLDAPLLISNDPFDGISYQNAQIQLPDRPGIGVIKRKR
jgi:L-alanine-DL-glutamate epimerase-like enolase superfamily enzyme